MPPGRWPMATARRFRLGVSRIPGFSSWKPWGFPGGRRKGAEGFSGILASRIPCGSECSVGTGAYHQGANTSDADQIQGPLRK